MSGRRVAVTGLGAITPLGRTAGDLWRAIGACEPGIAPIESVDRSRLGFEHGAEVRGFDPCDHLSAESAKALDRSSQFAVIAAREALEDCGRPLGTELLRRSAVVTGCSLGGQRALDDAMAKVYRDGRRGVHPLTIPRAMVNAGASHIAIEFGIQGPSMTISTACASANHAIGQAFWMVRGGLVDLAVAGGSEAPFTLPCLKAWEALRVVAPDTCRPFSRDRQGLILGEGGAMLVLEPLDDALARKAPVYAEVVGFGMSSDAAHITQPSVDGPVRAMRAALEDAGLDASEIDYVNAHGSGTLVNDPTEARALTAVFGEGAVPPVSSTKSLHGHGLGAAGALEAVATVLALRHGLLPPTANFTSPDPDCDIDVVANAARPADIGAALSNAFAFGGFNAVLAFRV